MSPGSQVTDPKFGKTANFLFEVTMVLNKAVQRVNNIEGMRQNYSME